MEMKVHRTIAKSIGTIIKRILKWVKQYEIMVKKLLKKRYTNYTQEFKLDVLNYMNEHGTSLNETAAIFNIPAPSTIRIGKSNLKHKE